MAIHSSLFAREIPWTEEPGALQGHRVTKSRHDRAQLVKHSLEIKVHLNEFVWFSPEYGKSCNAMTMMIADIYRMLTICQTLTALLT